VQKASAALSLYETICAAGLIVLCSSQAAAALCQRLIAQSSKLLARGANFGLAMVSGQIFLTIERLWSFRAFAPFSRENSVRRCHLIGYGTDITLVDSIILELTLKQSNIFTQIRKRQ
jgi:hypothetical protein